MSDFLLQPHTSPALPAAGAASAIDSPDNSEVVPKAEKLVRRRAVDSIASVAKELERRRMGTIAMAIVAILLLAHRRLSYDSLAMIAFECIGSLFFLLLSGRLAKKWMPRRLTESLVFQAGTKNIWNVLCITACVAMPWIVNPLAKQLGNGNGLEIVMLTSLGWGGLSLALLSLQFRTLSLSVVCSGFLTLFATFISDSPNALWFSLVWGILCLWWLVSNYWSQVATAAAVGVQPARIQRIVFTSFGCVVFVVGASLVSGRFPVVRKLQTELMPTSGGTTGKDAAARRGLGNGDALVAAKKHATSFGAVETNVFLDSEQPSLFDVFSDEFGEPKKRTRHESAQALSPQNIKNEGGNSTEGNRSASSSEFSIERELPEERKPVNDLVAESLMFWQGESGTHLAAQRFTHFDGAVWSNSEVVNQNSSRAIEGTIIGKQSWFGPSGISVQNSISPFVDSLPEAIKFTRYRSPTIPTRQGIQLWCIDQIDRQDFFAISLDGCLQMPDREHVPDYTVVRMINSRIDLERLEDLVRNCAPGKIHTEQTDACRLELNRLAHLYAVNLPRGWPQVQSVISKLRTQFVLDHVPQAALSDSNIDLESFALNQFLQHRRGPDYLFATAAALMLDHLGYRTRFVAGFYANPKNYIVREAEIAILPTDAHAWLEIDVGHGYWIPLEPSPGYRLPQYAASLWYRMNQHRWAIAMWTLTVLATAMFIYLLRGLLIEWVSWVAYPTLFLLNDRLRVSWLTWLLEIRCRVAGIPRARGTVLRKHLHCFRTGLPSDLYEHVHRFLESADRMWYGGVHNLPKSDQAAIARVWQGLTIRALRKGNRQMQERRLA
jgi:protein-glutamine gamma-glutamyltransferase